GTEAAELAASRPHPRHYNNNEEYEYRDDEAKVTHIANFTKGLPHDTKTGLLLNPVDYKLFVTGIQSGDPVDFKNTPLGPGERALEKPGEPIEKTPSIEHITARSGNADRRRVWMSFAARHLGVGQTAVPSPVTDVENAAAAAELARATAEAARAQAVQKKTGAARSARTQAEDDLLDAEAALKTADNAAKSSAAEVRAWESAGAGNVFDLQGPDAQAVTMPPAPRFDSEELLAEIAEVYAMALLRDVPFREFPLAGIRPLAQNPDYMDALKFMRSFQWLNPRARKSLDDPHNRRRRIKRDWNGFRGVTPGENVGPYLSQFLLLGNNSLEMRGVDSPARTPDDGFILYGALGIEQKVRVATPKRDYMTAWEPYIDVQNGADFRGQESYEEPRKVPKSKKNPGDICLDEQALQAKQHRFIATPRDLATYVHYDALYEAYLNACLFLLSSGAPFDRGIPFLEADPFDKQQGFAHFGGPHILSLVTEVATRALKAVRYQKFNIHRRLRPEAMGGLFDRWMNNKNLRGGQLTPFSTIADGLKSARWGSRYFKTHLARFNKNNNKAVYPQETSVKAKSSSYLLPMAFPEGSPMHPSYGAGHATVAGACVTILKAYFDHGWTPPALLDKGKAVAYEPSMDGSKLVQVKLSKPLTVEGELNKLAANIAIGRNWAGVHYYSDYIESIRMGEEIAIGLLEEQKLQYPENFTMTVPLFDGGAIRI
ncbi:MAG: vanadium-dependent haloperoxidase, partial [Bacteroidota bacterium]